MIHMRLDTRSTGLKGLGASDLATGLAGSCVVGHVLRFERRHTETSALCDAAQSRNDDGLSYIGARTLNHQRTGAQSAPSICIWLPLTVARIR